MGSSGWSNDNLEEVVAPASMPFLPGNNVIGMGTALPQEMKDAGFTAGIVFYSAGYKSTSTTPKVKFWYLAINDDSAGLTSGIVLGAGLVTNPHVSEVATTVDVFQFGISLDPSSPPNPGMFFSMQNVLENTIAVISEDENNDGTGTWFDNDGTDIFDIP